MRNLTIIPLSLPEQDRWFLWSAPLYGVGIAIYFDQTTEPHWIVATLPLFLAFCLRRMAPAPPAVTILLNIACLVAAGFATAKLRTEWVRAPVLNQPLRNVVVTGHLIRREVRTDQSQRITLLVVAIDGLAQAQTPARVRVRVKARETRLPLGTLVRLRARLASPPGPARPNGYDFARAAYYQGIGAVGFALSAPRPLAVQPPLPITLRLHVLLQTFRQAIGARIERALPGEVGVMANALMTGERSGISKTTNELYRDAGIFHILSISGLHMAIMGGSVFVALRFVLAAFPAVALRYPIKKWAAAVAAVATFGYLLISGGAHPTVRSFIMILIMFAAILLDRPAIALRNVAIAALVILALLPESLFNAGFQLSFAAVTALVSAYETHRDRAQRRQGPNRRPIGAIHRVWRAVWLFLIGTIVTTAIAGLTTAPFGAFHFHAAQQYSILTNMLAIPLSNLLVMPAALAAFIAMPFGLQAAPLWLMGAGIEAMTWSARQVATLPGAVVAIPAFSERALQLMIAGGLWFCIWRQAWRWLGLLVAVCGVLDATQSRRPDALIGGQGRLVAIRDAAGLLAAVPARRARYEFERWLQADGDTRSSAEAWARHPFRCDLEGCVGRVGRHRLMVPRSPAALVDDCARTGVLVLSFPKPAGCVTKAIVLDYRDLRRNGTHALHIARDGSLRIETVEHERGHRPWTEAARRATRTGHRRSARSSDKPGRVTDHDTAAKIGPRRALPRRPDIEDDGHPLYWWR